MIRSILSRSVLFLSVLVAAAVFLPGSVHAAGLVPCGDASTPCTLCHFITGMNSVILTIRNVMVFIALAIITGMGIVYIVSAGDPKMMETAKGGIRAALIGIVIVLFAWFIVNMIMFYVFAAKSDLGVGANFKGANGFQFQCSTVSRSMQ